MLSESIHLTNNKHMSEEIIKAVEEEVVEEVVAESAEVTPEAEEVVPEVEEVV